MNLKEIIDLALKEDLGKLKDITSRAIFTEESKAKAKIFAKEAGVIAGASIVKEVFHHVDPSLYLHTLVKDGDQVSFHSELFIIEGKTISILEGERIALNFLSHLSGIASETRKYVEEVKGTGVTILDTRKTLPGFRELEKQAVLHGGGMNHRMGLYDRILIKDNHVEACGGVIKAVEKVRESYGDDFFIEVETQNMKEVEEALKEGVDQILLDNMNVDEIKDAVKAVNGKIPLEASGNITLATVRQFAETGVQFISVGAITQSAKALDMSLRFMKSK